MMKINNFDTDKKSMPAAPAYNTKAAKGIYVHIPFCLSKCIYCDFVSYAGCSIKQQRRYFDALIREAALVKSLCAAPAHRPDTIFIGGGTPSSVDASLMTELLNVLPRRGDAEITIECNPAAVPGEGLLRYRAAGINRLSMGVQSFNDSELGFLGRAHSAGQAELSFAAARRAGFDNINLDLIFGFPGQTLKSWRDTLKKAVSLEPEHISFYSLQIEEGTPLYEKFKRCEINQISDELNREMYHEAATYLKSSGYLHYEISNAAKPGRECRHNLKYWSMVPYIGIGASAHSFDGRRRFYNPEGLAEYEVAVDEKCLRNDITAAAAAEENTFTDSVTDYIFTGMRLTEGLDRGLFYDMFGMDIAAMPGLGEKLRRLEAEGLLELTEKKLRFTAAGLDISNYIIGELME